MLTVRRFRVDDYFAIDRRRFDMLTYLNFPDPQAMAENLHKGPAETIINSRHIIASYGIVPFWKGVGEAWAVTSDLVTEHGVFFAKTVFRGLVRTMDELKLDRVQTSVDVDHLVSRKWVEWMGFRNEGNMRKYIGGHDYIRYALVRS